MSLPIEEAAPRGSGTCGRRGRERKVTAGRGASTATLESRKRKRGGRGWGIAEPVDIRIEREIAGKISNSKKVVIG